MLEARANRRTHPVQLYDVSITGCRIDCSGLDVSRRDRISFKFAEKIVGERYSPDRATMIDGSAR